MTQAPKVRAYLKDRLMRCLSTHPQMRARDALSRVEQAALPQLPARLARRYRQYCTRCRHEIARAFQILKREGLAVSSRHGFWSLTEAGRHEARRLHGTGRPNPARKSAVEIRALEIAEAHYQARGFRTRRVGRPYDLVVTRPGRPRRTVEVKGCRKDRPLRIEITARELTHARRAAQHDLIVVGGIVADENGASGGRIVLFVENWRPEDQHLKPTQYRYLLPDDPEGGMP